jgi:putative addiction module killer protein
MLQYYVEKRPDKPDTKAEQPETKLEANAIPGRIYTLETLVQDDASCPFEDWRKGIRDTQTRQRIQNRLDRIERGNLGDCSSVGDGVFEFRLMFGAGYRIYFALADDVVIVLLAGGDKSSQAKDIILAQGLWKDYKDAIKGHG